MDLAFPADHKVKLKISEERSMYLDLARELKKLRNMKMTVIPIIIGTLGTVSKGLIQGLEEVKIRGRDHQDYCIVGIDQNPKKSPGNWRRFALTQTLNGKPLPCLV